MGDNPPAQPPAVTVVIESNSGDRRIVSIPCKSSIAQGEIFDEAVKAIRRLKVKYEGQ